MSQEEFNRHFPMDFLPGGNFQLEPYCHRVLAEFLNLTDVNENPQSGYGFVFDRSNPPELLRAIDRALELYSQRRHWLTIVKRGMAQDFSWGNSAEQYQKLYLDVCQS